MYEKEVFMFNKPYTNIVCYGYSIFKDSILIKTVYYNSNFEIMTYEQALLESENEIANMSTGN